MRIYENNKKTKISIAYLLGNLSIPKLLLVRRYLNKELLNNMFQVSTYNMLSLRKHYLRSLLHYFSC